MPAAAPVYPATKSAAVKTAKAAPESATVETTKAAAMPSSSAAASARPSFGAGQRQQ